MNFIVQGFKEYFGEFIDSKVAIDRLLIVNKITSHRKLFNQNQK